MFQTEEFEFEWDFHCEVEGIHIVDFELLGAQLVKFESWGVHIAEFPGIFILSIEVTILSGALSIFLTLCVNNTTVMHSIHFKAFRRWRLLNRL